MNEKGRADKKVRVNAGLSELDHKRLERLAFATGVPKTILAAELIGICLGNPEILEIIQRRHNAERDRRIIPVFKDGQIHY